MLEVLIRKLIDLVEEVPDIDTAERIHLGKRQYAGKPVFVS
jgi:hypothetical protein